MREYLGGIKNHLILSLSKDAPADPVFDTTRPMERAVRFPRLLPLTLTLVLCDPALAEEPAKQATLYKNPGCGCCEGHARHLRENGYDVTEIPTEEMRLLRQQHGVPEALFGCHTLLVDGYVVEGHVPAAIIDRLLAERPPIRGISLPGMPDGSPGMSGAKTAPFTIYEISDGEARIFAVD